MKIFNSHYQIEFGELSTLLNKKEVRDILNYKVGKIEEAVKNGHSMKSVRQKLGIEQGRTYTLRDKQCNIISNFGYIVKAAEEFCTHLHSTQDRHATFIRSGDEEATEDHSIASDEVRKALQAMTDGKY